MYNSEESDGAARREGSILGSVVFSSAMEIGENSSDRIIARPLDDIRAQSDAPGHQCLYLVRIQSGNQAVVWAQAKGLACLSCK